MHKYWHFVDKPYSAGAPEQPPKTPNALTEIEKLSAALATDESDGIKS
jgi:S1/P1 nuclease